MKRKAVNLVIVSVLAICLFLPVQSFGGGNSPVPKPEEKIIGPSLKGTVIAAWRPNYAGDTLGTIDYFVRVEDKLYVKKELEVPSDYFCDELSTPAGLLEHDGYLPEQIAQDFNMGESAVPKVCDEKDISNFGCSCDLDNDNIKNINTEYEYILHCDIRISFIVPK
jgi:hypothetical protein